MTETVPLSLSLEVSSTVAVHIMVSALDARAAVRVSVELVPKDAPEVVLVQVKLEDSESPSSSLALTEQVRVLSLLGEAGLTLTEEISGAVLPTVIVTETPESESVPSSATMVTNTESPLSKYVLPESVLLDPPCTMFPLTVQKYV